MSSYGAKILTARGVPCTILRDIPVNLKVSIKKATTSVQDNYRDSLRDGVILASAGLSGGEVIEVLGDKFLVRSVSPDYASGQTYFFASKINAELIHKRLLEVDNGYGNITFSWKTITNEVYSSAHVVSAELRQQEAGLLETTIMVLLVNSSISVQKLDRLQFLPDGQKLQVDAIDDIKLPGIRRIQCSEDSRQDGEENGEDEEE